ncbi:MAG: PfkB family carbohydrate kinase [[Clostridium] leptum]
MCTNICSSACAQKSRTVVDATGQPLTNVLYRPFLIKPNHHELGIFSRPKDRRIAARYAHKLQEQGARNVLVYGG